MFYLVFKKFLPSGVFVRNTGIVYLKTVFHNNHPINLLNVIFAFKQSVCRSRALLKNFEPLKTSLKIGIAVLNSIGKCLVLKLQEHTNILSITSIN